MPNPSKPTKVQVSDTCYPPRAAMLAYARESVEDARQSRLLGKRRSKVFYCLRMAAAFRLQADGRDPWRA